MLSSAIKFILSLGFVVIAAALYTLFTLDLNDYRQDIELAAYQATGRELQLEGELALTWSPTPSIVVNKAYFANAPWASTPNMVTLQKFELGLAIYPLVYKQLQITKVLLQQPIINIETDSEGNANWVLAQVESEQETEQSEEASSFASFIVNDLNIEQAKINFIDGVSKQQTEFVIDTLSVDINNLDDPFSVLFKAAYDQIPIEVEGQLGGLNALINNQLAELDLDASLAGVEFSLAGEVAQPHLGKGVDVQVQIMANDTTLSELAETTVPPFGDIEIAGLVATDAESDLLSLDLNSAIEGVSLAVKGHIEQPQLAKGIALDVELKTDSTSMSKLAGSELPPIGDIQLSGLVSGGEDNFTLENMQLLAGESDLTGDINIALSSEKPVINANLHSKLIDLASMQSQEGGSTSEKDQSKDKSDARLFSDDPIVLAGLKQVDSQLKFTADTISTAGLKMKDFNVQVNLLNGNLSIKPLTFGFAGSQLNGELALNSREELARLSSKLQVNGFKLSKVDTLSDTISGGNTDIFMQIRGEGTSVQKLMAGLDGKAIVRVAESQIADGTLDILGADFFAELAGMLNPFAKEEKGTELACAVVKFDIKDGIATAKKGIAVQTGKLNIVGDGTINLRNEEIDISIKPEPRTGIGVNISQLASLVKVGGTLANPGAEVDAAAVLTTGVSSASAVATGGISVVAKGLIDRTTADVNPCETALNPK